LALNFWINQIKQSSIAPRSSILLILASALFFIGAERARGATFELRIVRSLGETEEVLYTASTRPLKTFRIGYTHSWDKCPVVENFRIEKDGTITLMEEIYGWFGAGLEFNPKTGFTDMKDHMVHIKNIERNMQEIPIRVGWICGFRLEYDNEVVPLTALAKPGELLTIKIFRKSDECEKSE
jgi:hypothetical protein